MAPRPVGVPYPWGPHSPPSPLVPVPAGEKHIGIHLGTKKAVLVGPVPVQQDQFHQIFVQCYGVSASIFRWKKNKPHPFYRLAEFRRVTLRESHLLLLETTLPSSPGYIPRLEQVPAWTSPPPW